MIVVSDTPSSDCLEKLDAIERAADALFRARGIRFAEPPATAETPERPIGYFAIAIENASRLPLGFARVRAEDGFAHLEQLSVDPAHARRGHGRALVEAAIAEAGARGYAEVTLMTYDEIPWNRPFYASCGFAVIDAPEAPFFERILAEEEELGLPLHGKRVCMRIRTPAPHATASP